MPSIWPVDRVVRAGLRDDLCDDVAGGRVNGVPVRPLERGHVEQPAVGRQRQAVCAARVLAIPHQPVGRQVEGRHTQRRRDVQPVRAGVRRDALDVLGRAAGGDIEGRNPPHEAVSGIDIEDEDANPAVLDVVADAGRGDVEEPPLGVGAAGRRRGNPCKQQQAGDELY